jgi:hypothetical protein
VRISTKRRTTADDVRKVALAALTTALDDGKQEVKKKPGLTGMRAVATGAVLYTAGRAVFTGRRFVREHLLSDDGEPEGREDEPDDEEYEDEPEAEEDEEPEAEEEEDFEEPEAEEEEDYEEPEEDDETAASRRPPVHAERGSDDEPEPDLPSRPSRSRAPLTG